MKQPLSFSDLLLAAFIVLKLCGVIDWHWLMVISPFWISIILTVILGLLKKEDKQDSKKSLWAQRMEQMKKDKTTGL